MLFTACFLILSFLNVKQGTEVHSFSISFPFLGPFPCFIHSLHRMPCLPSFSTYSSHLYSRIQVELNPLFLWWPLSEVSRHFFATGLLYTVVHILIQILHRHHT